VSGLDVRKLDLLKENRVAEFPKWSQAQSITAGKLQGQTAKCLVTPRALTNRSIPQDPSNAEN
jgi:hypothetical protein